MASDYPASIDAFPDPLVNSPLNSPSHAALHQDVNDAVEKIETKVGVGVSDADDASVNQVLMADGAGGSAWESVTNSKIDTVGVPAQRVLASDGAGGAVWSGEASGLWKTASASVTAQPTLTVDNCFSADYDNYRIVIDMVGVSNNNFLLMRLLDSAGSQLTTNYSSTVYGQDYSTGSTVFNTINRTDAQPLGWLPNGTTTDVPMGVQLDVFKPFATTQKTLTNGLHTGANSGNFFVAGSTFLSRLLKERNRGLLFFNNLGTNMTGTVRVYGYRN